MNQPQAPEKPQKAPPSPMTPQPHDAHDLLVRVFAVCIAATLLLSVALVVLLYFRPASRPGEGDTSAETTAAAGESTGDPNHVPVTYPTAASREDYRFTGTGSTMAIENLSAKSAILVSLSDYSVVSSLDADAPIYPASMTKIMTLIVACENIKDATVTLTVDQKLYETCAKAGATTLVAPSESYPVVNDSFSATDMLYSVGILSAADACLVLANHIAGSEEAFVALMNEKCTALGLTKTKFVNCTGLDSDSGENENVSTVREMATILAYALDNPFCKEILTTDERLAIGTYNEGTPFPYNRYLINTLTTRLGSAGFKKQLPVKIGTTRSLLGGKTGYTDKGKFCLASVASDDSGKLYIVVTAAGETSVSSITDLDAIHRAYP